MCFFESVFHLWEYFRSHAQSVHQNLNINTGRTPKRITIQRGVIYAISYVIWAMFETFLAVRFGVQEKYCLK